MKRSSAVAALLLALASADHAEAGGEFALPVPFEGFPNYVAAGVGVAPDYFGSDDYMIGGLPAANWDIDVARLRLLGNWAMLDLLPESPWSVGPSGVMRFGRSGVDDAVVSRLPDIDITVELGASVGYELVDAANPLKRLAIGADVVHDVGGVHSGLVVNGYVRGTYPLWWRGGAITGLIGATYGDDDFTSTYFSVSPGEAALSGLQTYNAGSGFRDVRVGAALFQSLSKNWHLGAGAVYARVLGDAADSPLVADRGSANQLVLGVGVAYAWGFDD